MGNIEFYRISLGSGGGSGSGSGSGLRFHMMVSLFTLDVVDAEEDYCEKDQECEYGDGDSWLEAEVQKREHMIHVVEDVIYYSRFWFFLS